MRIYTTLFNITIKYKLCTDEPNEGTIGHESIHTSVKMTFLWNIFKLFKGTHLHIGIKFHAKQTKQCKLSNSMNFKTILHGKVLFSKQKCNFLYGMWEDQKNLTIIGSVPLNNHNTKVSIHWSHVFHKKNSEKKWKAIANIIKQPR